MRSSPPRRCRRPQRTSSERLDGGSADARFCPRLRECGRHHPPRPLLVRSEGLRNVVCDARSSRKARVAGCLALSRCWRTEAVWLLLGHCHQGRGGSTSHASARAGGLDVTPPRALAGAPEFRSTGASTAWRRSEARRATRTAGACYRMRRTQAPATGAICERLIIRWLRAKYAATPVFWSAMASWG